MKLTFKSYSAKTTLNEGGDYGIAHLEDLDIESFLRFVEKIDELDAVQKLDGANLRVGLDDGGELFTSREQKGGRRFYHEADFPKNSAYDGFKAAHVVLSKNEAVFAEVLSQGESINLEIIFGEQPNTVFYGKNNLNYIALLEMLPGDDPSIEPDQGKLKELMNLLKGKTTTVRTLFSDTADGVTIQRAPRVTDWQFTVSDKVSAADVKSVNFSKELAELKRFLKSENDKARSIGKDLTNFEVLKDRSRDLADERKDVLEKILTDYKLPIKQKFLDLVGKQKPSLRGNTANPDDGVYHGIEGIIFTDPKTRERFKIVDKEVFTSINKFNYQTRKTVASRIMTTDAEVPLESRGGVVGEAKIRSMRMFGLENAELPSQTKKVIEKFKSDSKEETLENIAKSLHQLDFSSIRRKIQAIHIAAIDDLEEALNSFKTGADEYKLELKNGKTIKYTKEIKRRTLMVFAEARRQLIETLSDVRKADDMHDLLKIFFSQALDKVFSEDKE